MKRLLLSTLAIVLLASCATQSTYQSPQGEAQQLAQLEPVPHTWRASPPKILPRVGDIYYTRFSFHHEKGQHIATNYARGLAWPINTEVKLLSMSERGRGSFELERMDTGERVTIVNVEEFTRVPLIEQASRMLSDRLTPLNHLNPDIRTAVESGLLRLGMDKETAVMARGYPPGHETPSLDYDTWKYWSSRFVVRTVVFRNGVLAEGRGLR